MLSYCYSFRGGGGGGGGGGISTALLDFPLIARASRSF